ncbi:MAG TPA: hypothetical protein VF735_03525 [Pyrinomonadaceae bacterium]|jgi:hypothetical protein
MKSSKPGISIVTLLMLAFAAAPVRAQLGDLMNRAKDKIEKNKPQTNQRTETNPTPTDATQQTNNNDNAQVSPRTDTPMNGALGWDQFRCNPEFTGAVDEGRLREVIQYNLNNDYGKGGLIVFTKQPLTKKNATIEDSVMTFKAGEPIYMNIVFKEPRKPYAGDIYLRIPGETIVTVGDTRCENKQSLYVDYERFAQMPSTIDFLPQGGKSAKHQQQVKSIAEKLRSLPPGVHIIPVSLDSISVIGAFYYDNRDGKANDDAIKAAIAEVKMPAPAVRMPALERQIISNWNNGPGSTALRVVIIDRDWSPLRNELGGIRGRYITAVMAKKENGRCFQVTQLWAQNYNGRTYTGLFLEGSRGGDEMDCANVMK